MGILHFLNVGEGDCVVIQHPSDHVTVIDVSNAKLVNAVLDEARRLAASLERASGNFNQKKYPVNPISYMKERNIVDVFRFILTHPDMDHMDGIKTFFQEFHPTNFWDTENRKAIVFGAGSPYDREDWIFYRQLRDGGTETNPRRLALLAGARGKYWNSDESGQGGGDGLHILAPTKELIADAVEADDYNDASYVILYHSNGGKILVSGDSHDGTWEYILSHHEKDVRDVDLLIAPHHGRKSDRLYEFLDVVNPALTFFGIARSEHLAYSAWRNRNLPVISNNQANCMIVDTDADLMHVYVTHEKFARTENEHAFYNERLKAWYWGPVTR